jgi:6-phosphogluconate dehydrogenase
MRLGFIGLGKMGLNMVTRLVRGGHAVLGTARTATRRPELEAAGGQWCENLPGLLQALPTPRAVWVMVPAGSATDEVFQALLASLSPGDLVIDGGNSDYRDTKKRHQVLSERGIRLVDAGTSGGVWGLKNGYCLMVGGSIPDVAGLEPVLTTLAPPDGWAHVGPVGAGHFVKMVHNAVEYGMMQSYAEGFALLREGGFAIDTARVAALWNQGSVVRSWLCELAAGVFAENPDLDGVKGVVDDNGECRWAIETAVAQGIPVPAMTAALFARFGSRQPDAFANKFLAALRNAFGGHHIHRD